MSGFGRSTAGVGNQTQHTGPSTFAFRKRWAQIDWRGLSSVDVDRIAQEMDFQALQQCIFNVTFCNIQSEEFRNVDLNFVKLFRLSQLIIEYLLYTQQYLTDRMSSLEQQRKQTEDELEKIQGEIRSKDLELSAVRKENRKRRRAIRAYQGMVNIPASDLHTCTVCQRVFVCEHCLLNHMQRRHPDHASLHRPTPPKEVDPEEIQAKVLEQVKERMKEERTQLRHELTEEAHQAEKEWQRRLEEWKEKEQERMSHEAQQSKELLMNELKQEQAERKKMEEELRKAREQITVLKARQKSHLGVLEGADEIDLHTSSTVVKQTQQEVEQLKDQFHAKLSQLEAQLKQQGKTWKKRMQKMTDSYQQKLQDSELQVQTLEQSLHESLANSQQQKKQLKTMQKRVQDHEQQLMLQQMNLSTLQERGLALPCSSPASAVCEGEEETDDASESEESGEEEETKFTPYPHRPTISTLYNHSSDQMTMAHKTAETLLSDALKQRGIEKNRDGLNHRQLTDGMKLLELQRHSQIQAHYNFMEHRNRLEREVEQISATEVRFVPPTDMEEFVKGQKKTKRKKEKPQSRTSHGSHESNPAASRKPPMPSASSAPVKGHPSLTTPPMSPIKPLPMSTASSSSPKQHKPASHKSPSIVITPSTTTASNSTEVRIVTVGGKMGGAKTQSEEESDLTSTLTSVSEGESDSDQEPSPQAGSQVAAATDTQAGKSGNQAVELTPVLPFNAESEEEDSLEEITMAPVSSTPAKTVASGRGKLDAVSTPAQSMVTIQPGSPAQTQGTGSVMLDEFPCPSPEEQSDTFSLSESTKAAPPVHLFSQPQIADSSIPALHGQKRVAVSKTVSRTVSSHSPLTNVSDNFDDSDFSDDLEVTHLT